MYECDTCNFRSVNKNDYNRHIKSEKHRSNTSIVEQLKQKMSELEKHCAVLTSQNDCLKQENESLKTIVKDLSHRPSTINNTFNIIQPIILSSTKFEEVCSIPLLMSGSYNAFYAYLYNNLFLDDNGNPKAVCTDYARKIIKWKNEDGEIVTDQKLRRFIGFYQNQYWQSLGFVRDDIYNYAEKNESSAQKLLKSLETVYLSGPDFVRFMVNKTCKTL